MTIQINIKKCLLLEILKKEKMTPAQLVEQTGISKTQISQYINNKRLMSLKNAKIISFVLKCSIDDLYEWIIIEKSIS